MEKLLGGSDWSINTTYIQEQLSSADSNLEVSAMVKVWQSMLQQSMQLGIWDLLSSPVYEARGWI
jgi:hypothetical protein